MEIDASTPDPGGATPTAAADALSEGSAHTEPLHDTPSEKNALADVSADINNEDDNEVLDTKQLEQEIEPAQAVALGGEFDGSNPPVPSIEVVLEDTTASAETTSTGQGALGNSREI